MPNNYKSFSLCQPVHATARPDLDGTKLEVVTSGGLRVST